MYAVILALAMVVGVALGLVIIDQPTPPAPAAAVVIMPAGASRLIAGSALGPGDILPAGMIAERLPGTDRRVLRSVCRTQQGEYRYSKIVINLRSRLAEVQAKAAQTFGSDAPGVTIVDGTQRHEGPALRMQYCFALGTLRLEVAGTSPALYELVADVGQNPAELRVDEQIIAVSLRSPAAGVYEWTILGGQYLVHFPRQGRQAISYRLDIEYR